MRTLHVIEEGWAASEALIAANELSAHTPLDILLIGGSEFERRAHAIGIPTTDRIAPPGGMPRFALTGLRNFVKDRGTPRTICCWSIGTARLVERAIRGARPVLMETCIRSTRRGAPARLSRPAIQRTNAPRDELRAMVGASSADVLVVPIASDDRAIDAWRLGFIFTVMETAGAAVVVGVPRRCRRVRRARRSQRMGMRPLSVRWVEAPTAKLIEGADLGLCLAERIRPRWTIMAAHAAGVPVVCEGAEGTEGLYPEGVGLIAAEGVASEMVRLIMELAEDPAKRMDLSARVKAHAGEARAIEAIGRSARAMVEP